MESTRETLLSTEETFKVERKLKMAAADWMRYPYEYPTVDEAYRAMKTMESYEPLGKYFWHVIRVKATVTLTGWEIL